MAMMPWKLKKLRSYFPLAKGCVWQYNLYNPVDHHVTINDSIFRKDDTTINGKRYVTIAATKAPQIFPAGYWRFDKAILYRYHTIKKRDVLFADFSKIEGQRSEYANDSIYTARVLSRDTSYTVPGTWKVNTSDEPMLLTTYTNVYCVEWSEKNNSEQVIVFFKQGVGLVGMKMAGGEELYLQGYVVKKR